MRAALALFVLAAAGCVGGTCALDHVRLDFQFSGLAANADQLTVTLQLGISQKSYTFSKTRGSTKESLDVSFTRSYARYESLGVDVVAAAGGTNVGHGNGSIFLGVCLDTPITVTECSGGGCNL